MSLRVAGHTLGHMDFWALTTKQMVGTTKLDRCIYMVKHKRCSLHKYWQSHFHNFYTATIVAGLFIQVISKKTTHILDYFIQGSHLSQVCLHGGITLHRCSWSGGLWPLPSIILDPQAINVCGLALLQQLLMPILHFPLLTCCYPNLICHRYEPMADHSLKSWKPWMNMDYHDVLQKPNAHLIPSPHLSHDANTL